MKEVYLDNAAATPVDTRALRAMDDTARGQGNPSALHAAGRRAAARLERARHDVARFLNAHPREVVFCASGSEANALAILGTAAAIPGRNHRLLTTRIEHPSVLGCARQLRGEGWDTGFMPVGNDGVLRPEAVTVSLSSRTSLISVAYANNEIGTIQPVKKLAALVRAWRREHGTLYPYLHVDASQAAAWLPMDVQSLGADLLTFNGAKTYGPHGCAVLFVRRGVPLISRIPGGDQEEGRRSGTEDVAGAAGLAAAVRTVRKSDTLRVTRLRDRLIAGALAAFPDARLNGPAPGPSRLANNVNISFPGADAEALVLELDRRGIRVGAGSACTARRTGPSHVLTAIGAPARYLRSAIRFSLSRYTTAGDIARTLHALIPAVAMVRERGR